MKAELPAFCKIDKQGDLIYDAGEMKLVIADKDELIPTALALLLKAKKMELPSDEEKEKEYSSEEFMRDVASDFTKQELLLIGIHIIQEALEMEEGK